MMADINVTPAPNVLDVSVDDGDVIVEISHTGPQGAAGPSGTSGGGGPAKTYIQQTNPGTQAIEYLWIELDGSGNVKTFWVYTP